MSDNRAKILGSQTIDATDLLLPRPRSIALETGTGPLAGLIKNAMLYPVFQPIAALDDGTLYAHEALIRGPQDSLLHMPSSLFLAARMEDLQFEFETEALILAIESWIEWQTPGRLFVNIGADVLVNVLNKLGIETLRRTLCDTDMKPRRLVLEITEHERVQDLCALANTVNDLRTLGVQFALDDFGDGHSSLRLWSEIKPDIVKIDKYFTRDIANHAQNLQTLRALMQIAEVFDTQLVAEGRAAWTGVRNYTARIHLRAMAVGDLCLYYHSNLGKEIVGVARVIATAYPDPTVQPDEKGEWFCVDVAPEMALPTPVTLAQIKADAELQKMELVRQSRLSVCPVTADEFGRVLMLGGVK
jgi:EAL domain-containing protein (putative c-di-GMP-specific phosphodiesterase class I)